MKNDGDVQRAGGREWEGRARPSMGSVDLCVSCGAKDTTGIVLTVVEQDVARARYERIAELCFSCASVVADGFSVLLSLDARRDAVHDAACAVSALRKAVTEASERVSQAEAAMERARQFPSEALDNAALPLLALIDRTRDALDEALQRSDVLPISSKIGNELECALERVMDARRLVTETDTSAPCAVCLAHTGEKCTDVANEPAPHSHRGSTLEHRAARLRAALLPQASRGKYGIR